MLSNLKKRLGVLTAVAVMAALVPVLAASPASAAASATTQLKSNTTLLEACPASASIASAGFTDTTSTDVDCIKYYGVTTGVTATTFEPAGTVTRETMALFLSRLATAMGVTLGDGSDQGFTDLPTSAASVTAINQIKQLGVTAGVTATTYSPDSNVTREQMAMFIERLLGNTAPGPNGNSADILTTNISGDGTTYNYADIDSGVTYEGHNSIAELYHLGVSDSATGSTAYRPSADITRAEMATFMTNAMAHSNARPAGLVLQATKNSAVGGMATIDVHELHVSQRAAAGSTGTSGTIVDVFGYKTTSVADNAAFAATGLCKDSALVTMGSVACYMEASDWVTNSTGNIEIQLSSAGAGVQVAESQTVQYWAWTAAAATSYVNGTTTGQSTTTLSSSYGGDNVYMTTSHPYAAFATEDYGPATALCHDAKMGSDVTITLQLKRTTGVSAALNVADAGVSIGVNSATGTHGGVNVATAIANSIIVTDASGTATYTASKAQTVSAADGDDTATFQVITFTNSATANATAGKTAIAQFNDGPSGTDSTDDAICIHWQDTARDDTTVATSVSNGYVSATAVGAGATNTVSATNYDQYGVGISGVSLGLTSAVDMAGASTYSVTMTTNSSGTATWGVTRDNGTSTREIFRVNDDDDNNGSATAYWVIAPGAVALDADEEVGSIPTNYITEATYDYAVAAANDLPEAAWVAFSAANDQLVADLHVDDTAHTYVVYTYDTNDQFTRAGAALDMATWEYYWSLIGASASGVLTAADDWGNGGFAKVATPSYVSQWGWAG